MGMNSHSAEFVLSAFEMGFRFERICTLGRSQLFMSPSKVHHLLEKYRLCPLDFWDRYPKNVVSYWADDLFRMIGIYSLDSMDYSTYENSTIVHDLNLPIPPALENRFDLVFDGGTLEHIFNFPVALRNAMQMVEVGGHLVIDIGMNNLCGHGFYQFSPELFYRAFTPENGFELLRMFAFQGSGRRVYHVVDPIVVHRRVELINNEATELLVHARKVRNAEIFAKAPQQSDYVSTWEAK